MKGYTTLVRNIINTSRKLLVPVGNYDTVNVEHNREIEQKFSFCLIEYNTNYHDNWCIDDTCFLFFVYSVFILAQD